MFATAQAASFISTGAGRDAIIRLVQRSGTLQTARTFPSRTFATSYQPLAIRPPRRLQPPWRPRDLTAKRPVRYNSGSTYHPPKKPESRFKELSRKYGWAAVGVYLGLSVLDFPFCFLAVRWLGSERIAAAEETVVEGFWAGMEKVAPGSRQSYTVWSEHLGERWREWRGMKKEVAMVEGQGPEETAQELRTKKHHEASLGTQLALAYALHKSLIFFRLPLTGAITPGIVKWLRKRGWNIGNPKAN